MPSSKKKNKQRKAKSTGGAGNAHPSPRAGARGAPKGKLPLKELWQQCFDEKMKTLAPHKAVERVRRGMGLSTHIVKFLAGGDAGPVHHRYLRRLVDAGLVSVLMCQLARCEEKLSDVIDTSGALPFITKPFVLSRGGEVMEGHLYRPSIWVDILLLMVGSEHRLGMERMQQCRMEIARGIGPLVKCIGDDMKRECFGSKACWYDMTLPLANLIYNLVGNCAQPSFTKDTIPILIDHDSMAEMAVRCIFWGDQRPDIMKESESEDFEEVLKPNNFAVAADYAGAFLEQVLKSHELEDDYKFYYDGAGKECNMRIGTTTIASQGHPGHEVPFISGLLSLLKGCDCDTMRNEHFLNRPSIFNILRILVVTGCVDRDVIASLVEVGTNSIASYDEAVLVMKAAFEATHSFTPGQRTVPGESRFAAAIESGLFEMILKLLARYNGERDTELICYMGMTLQAAQSLILHRKSCVAIGTCHASVMEALRVYSSGASRTCANAGKCSDIICYSCSKTVSGKDRKYCAKCNVAVYCSKECQVQHWKRGGHKLACSSMGVSAREAKSVEEQQRVLCGITKRLFCKNRSQLVVDATLRGLNIVDCFVVVDLTVAPPSVDLVDTKGAAFDSTVTQTQPSPKDGLRFLVLQRKVEDAVTRLAQDGSSPFVAKKQDCIMFPDFTVGMITWPSAQKQLKEHFGGQLERLRKDPSTGVDFLEKLKDDTVRDFVVKKLSGSAIYNDPQLREGAIEGMVASIREAENGYEFGHLSGLRDLRLDDA